MAMLEVRLEIKAASISSGIICIRFRVRVRVRYGKLRLVFLYFRVRVTIIRENRNRTDHDFYSGIMSISNVISIAVSVAIMSNILHIVKNQS